MATVFVSYRRKESSILANTIVERLRRLGIDVYIDVDSSNSTGPFPALLRREIDVCKIFICLLADTTLESGWVKEEIKLACERDKLLIPIRQESFIAPEVPENQFIWKLLESQGVVVFDQQNLFFEESMQRLINMIQPLTAPPSFPNSTNVNNPTQFSTLGWNSGALASSIPSKTYRYLIGREVELGKIMQILRQPEKTMAALIGLGGIGKTALANEIVEKSRTEGIFDSIVWTSAKHEHFIAERIQRDPHNYELTFDKLLETIGHQCNRPDIARLGGEQKEIAVASLLSQKRVFVVVDNLDTLPNPDELVSRLYIILGLGKALFTSRHRLKNEQLYSISLSGLGITAGLDFLRIEAETRNVTNVLSAPKTELTRIHKVAGGAPLAMKLIVGQVSRQPLDAVLRTLEQASSTGQDYDFYRFVYQKSWELLDKEAQMAFVGMSVFPPIIGGTVESVRQVLPLDASAFEVAMDKLVTLSLVDKIGAIGKERFALHPLSQYFIQSDITKEWTNA